MIGRIFGSNYSLQNNFISKLFNCLMGSAKSKGCSSEPRPILTKAPLEVDDLPFVKEEDRSSERVFNEDSKGEFERELDYKEEVVENDISENVDGEDGKGENEQDKLLDGIYVAEAVRKKQAGVQSVGLTGAKKRKSGPVKRFKTVPSTIINEIMGDDLEDMRNDIIEIVKVVSFPIYSTDDTDIQGVDEIMLLVKRSNGKHILVNKNFLKEHYLNMVGKFFSSYIIG
nr:hypothetical protein Iba_chr04fCG9830 [Ipomoea batatas]